MSRHVLTDSEVATEQATQAPGESAVGAGVAAYPLSLPNEAYLTKMTRQDMVMIDMARVSSGVMAFKSDTGALKLGITAGKFFAGDTEVSFTASEALTLTTDQINYVYLTAAGVATANITGFPTPSVTPHIPVAIISAGSTGTDRIPGSYTYDDIDHSPRSRAFLSVAGASGDNLTVTSGGEVTDTHTVTVQARDAANNNLAERCFVRVWISESDYGASSDTDNTVSITTGTIFVGTAHRAYTIISDANGTVVLDLTVAGNATRYVLAEMNGRIYSSGALAFTV